MKGIDNIKGIVVTFVVFGTFYIVLTAYSSPDSVIDKVTPTNECVETQVDSLEVLAHAFAMVESTDNPTAYNESSGASGWLQFKPIMVDEANRIRNLNEGTRDVEYYCYDDRWDKETSKDMFMVVMRYRNPSGDVRKACKIWNYTHSERYYKVVLEHYERMLEEKILK